MAEMTISIPDALKNWAEERAVAGHYGSAGDYVRALVQRDREVEEALRRLQAAIDEGLASEISERDPFDYLNDLRAGLRARSGSADAA